MPGRRDRRPATLSGCIALCVIVLITTAACSSSSSGSRHTLYDSIDSLAADSSAILVGTVSDQSTAGGTTVSSVAVTNAPTNPQLGGNLADPPEPPAAGDVVEVREDQTPTLSPGEEYLLFLTPTMLPGDASTQYFITGAVAGIYVRDGEGFRRAVPDSGDTLPDTITAVGEHPAAD